MPIAVPIGNENSLKQPKTNSSVSAQLLLFSKATPPIIDGIAKNNITITAMTRMNGTIQTKIHSPSGQASSMISGNRIDKKADTNSIINICSEPEMM